MAASRRTGARLDAEGMSRAVAALRRRDGGGEVTRGAARPARRADARRGLGVVSTTTSSKVTAVRRALPEQPYARAALAG